MADPIFELMIVFDSQVSSAGEIGTDEFLGLNDCECCQDDSVNCSCFRKNKMTLKASSIHVRARVRMSIVQLSCIRLWAS